MRAVVSSELVTMRVPSGLMAANCCPRRTVPSISLSRRAASYLSRPRLRSQIPTSMVPYTGPHGEDYTLAYRSGVPCCASQHFGPPKSPIRFLTLRGNTFVYQSSRKGSFDSQAIEIVSCRHLLRTYLVHSPFDTINPLGHWPGRLTTSAGSLFHGSLAITIASPLEVGAANEGREIVTHLDGTVARGHLRQVPSKPRNWRSSEKLRRIGVNDRGAKCRMRHT